MSGAGAELKSLPVLETNIVRFIRLLRHLGLRVSSAESVDALRALGQVDLLNRGEVKSALGATLVKEPDGVALFNQAFDLYFATADQRSQQVAQFQDRRVVEAQMVQSAEADLVLQDEPLNLAEAYKLFYAQLPETEKQKVRDFLKKTSEGHHVDEKFQPVAERVVKGQLDFWKNRQHLPPPKPDLHFTGEEDLDAIIEQVALDAPAEGNPLLYEDMKNIAREDLPRAIAIIRKLSRRLATKISRRYRQSSKVEKIDLRRSIRQNLRYGGAMFSLSYKTKKVQKPKLLLICDVSGSMALYTSFILQFIFGLAGVVRDLEGFIFAEDLERITPYFARGRSFESVMDRITGASRQWGKGTNLGVALNTFFKKYETKVTPNTIGIIVSDAKTIGAKPAAELVARLRHKVKDLLWLNTIPKKDWPQIKTVGLFAQDSRMMECYTLAHLEKILKSML